jgi:hypothetical protein
LAWTQNLTFGIKTSAVSAKFEQDAFSNTNVSAKKQSFITLGFTASQRLMKSLWLHEELNVHKASFGVSQRIFSFTSGAFTSSTIGTETLVNSTVWTFPIYIEWRTDKNVGFEFGTEYNRYTGFIGEQGVSSSFFFGNISNANWFLGCRYTFPKNMAIDLRYTRSLDEFNFFEKKWGLEVSFNAFLTNENFKERLY